MSWPAAIRPARAARAKSGVPMKARRMADAGLDGNGVELFRLHQFAQDDIALEGGQMVDEENSVEVVHLVLDAGCQQTLGLALADLVLMIEIAHLYGPRPDHIGIMFGQRKTAFVENHILV